MVYCEDRVECLNTVCGLKNALLELTCRYINHQTLKIYVNSFKTLDVYINPLNAELNPICNLLALLGAHHILHVSRVRVNEDKKIL